MNIGDSVVNVPGRLSVFYEGVGTYSIYEYNGNSKGFHTYSGTIEELLLYLGDRIKKRNRHIEKFGTRYVGEKI
jgi:hypothetical protein